MRGRVGEGLVEEGVVTRDEADGMVAAFRDMLETEFQAAASYRPNKADWLDGKWRGIESANGDYRAGETAIELENTKRVGAAPFSARARKPSSRARVLSRLERMPRSKSASHSPDTAEAR